MEKLSNNTIFSAGLSESPAQNTKRTIPLPVVKRAKSAGAAGEAWLADLDHMIAELEERWNISVGDSLRGGTHAFVACATGANGEQCVLKIDMPENLGGEFLNSIAALKTANGQGYVKLYAYDLKKKACLLERLGKPVDQLGYTVYEQLRIICYTLQQSWKIPAVNTGFPSGYESIAWFREFIGEAWEIQKYPCSQRVIERAFCFLSARERAINPAEFVLLHGDAHGGNTLKARSGTRFKLIDPDGIFYEKAYDLGVLMREWIDEYQPNPLQAGKERCSYLHRLTGAPAQAIWEWGYLQTVSTAFVLLRIGQEETGQKMLQVAECWAHENVKAAIVPEQRAVEDLANFLLAEYGFVMWSIVPAERGFYGETWKAQTDRGVFFLKIDYWQHHQESYQCGLAVMQYMAENGISFIPKVVKTKNGRMWSRFKNGVAAVLTYVQGTSLETCSAERLYGCLAEIYRLKTGGIKLKAETFGIEPITTFQNLRHMPGLPAEAVKALDRKERVISWCAERLKRFSAVCRGDQENFYITHGDAGGNCILNGDRLFIVDWDSAMLAPIERDAWIFVCDRQQLNQINAVLAEKGVGYILEPKRLGYYCYSFFFCYLNEYLKALINTTDAEQKTTITKNLVQYLAESWIYKRLNAADRISIDL